jgi:hypothetical protein
MFVSGVIVAVAMREPKRLSHPMTPIYLDFNASTPIDPTVAALGAAASRARLW